MLLMGMANMPSLVMKFATPIFPLSSSPPTGERDKVSLREFHVYNAKECAHKGVYDTLLN